MGGCHNCGLWRTHCVCNLSEKLADSQPPVHDATVPGKPSAIGKVPHGGKETAGKTRLELMQFRAIHEYGRVLTFGATKYAPASWRHVVGGRLLYLGAGLRHIFKWIGGERVDPETGCHHLAHAMCDFAFLLEVELDPAGEPEHWRDEV